MIKKFTLEFGLDTIKVIGDGLQYLPYHMAAPIIKEIELQVNQQLEAEKVEVTTEGKNTVEE